MTYAAPTDGPAVAPEGGPGDARPQQSPGRRLGTSAVVLGVVGIVFALFPATGGFGIFLGVVALVLGIIGLCRKGRRALAGTVVGAVAILLGALLSNAYSGGAATSASSATSSPDVTTAAAPAKAGAAEESETAEEATKPSEPAKKAAPAGSVGQLQALAAATGYLDSGMGFSQASLLGQLTSTAGNGFSQADSQWAIDHSGADWNAQALSAANGYLKSGMGFSEQSLAGQLTSSAGNQFTADQAAYAVANSGADWNAQAVDAAKGYVSSGMGFSRQSLIDQLSSSAGNQFTPDQAAAAATAVGLN